MLAFSVSTQQSAITDQVDQPGNALTFLVQPGNCAGIENISTHTGNTQAVAQIVR